MKQNPHDIAGHHVVLKVTTDEHGQAYMFVDRVPLSYQRPPGPHARLNEEALLIESRKSAQSSGNFGWLRNLPAQMNDEKERVDKLYPRHVSGMSNKKWSCPLRRLAFWSKIVDDPDFSPLVPSPPRIERLFAGSRNMNFASRSHPTMEFSTSTRMPNIFTSNGFCFCVSNAEACIVQNNTNTVCTFENTIKSLHDQTLRKSKTLLSTSNGCRDQLDWPYVSGRMRDDTVVMGRKRDGLPNINPDVCDISDRLPPFWYRYMPNGNITAPRTTSLDKGGACHMGVAPELSKTFTYKSGICRKLHETRLDVTVICHYSDGLTSSTMVLNKTLSKAPGWAVEQMKKKRQQCDQCPATPSWTDHDGDALPKGPEVSYGIPFRWSAARLLAGDLKSLLCGAHHNGTAECKSLMNESAWGLQSFIEHFTGDASALFKTRVESPLSSLPEAVRADDPVDDADLWDGANASWVACSQQPGGRCFGGMKKEEWYSADRGTHCVQKFTNLVLEGKVNESTVPLDICTLDASLDDLCKKLQNALLLVQTGNCIAAAGGPGCHPKAFVYSPGMYSQSNQDFVRGTVLNFYETYGLETTDAFDKDNTPNFDLVCPLDDEEADLRKRNHDLTQNCASRQLESVQYALKIARQVVHVIVQVGFIQTQLVLTFARLLIPGLGDMEAVVQEIEFWFMQLVMVIFDSLKEIGNLLFRMISDTGGIGNAMKTLVNALCMFVNVLLEVYNNVLCELMKKVTMPICKIFLDLLRPIISFFGGDTAIFDFLDRIIHAIQGSTCSLKWECNQLGVSVPTQLMGSLPVTSRCWVDYVPNVDDASSYACSRSDTCSQSDLTYGVTNQVRIIPYLLIAWTSSLTSVACAGRR
jgi:hypothetical protein